MRLCVRLLSFFSGLNHAQFSHTPEKDTTEDNTTVWSLMNFLVLLWVGNFDYIWYKIIDHGGIGRYEMRVIPDGHPREGEIYIIIKDDRSRGLSESLPSPVVGLDWTNNEFGCYLDEIKPGIYPSANWRDS